jgi:TPR repeat protein
MKSIAKISLLLLLAWPLLGFQGDRAAEDFRTGCELGNPGACELLKDLELNRIEHPTEEK